MNDTIERSQTHATFVVERTLSCARCRGLARPVRQRRTRPMVRRRADVRRSHTSRTTSASADAASKTGRWQGGPRSRFESTYTDIVDQHRIVFTYDMWVDDQHLSTSLTTIAVEPDGEATRLTYTEQAVHFDGLDSVEGREEGTRGILDGLGSFLTRDR